MFQVTQIQTSENIIKKSRFVGMLVPCSSEQIVLQTLKKCHAQHPNANHQVYAYRLKTDKGFLYRCSDAGEPTGTAGKPVLQHLEGKNIVNALLVVVRYFGGIKLGAGGLTRAYSQTARQVIEQSIFEPYVDQVTLTFTLDYEKFALFEYTLKKCNAQIITQTFSEQVNAIVQVDAEHAESLKHLFSCAEQGKSLQVDSITD